MYPILLSSDFLKKVDLTAICIYFIIAYLHRNLDNNIMRARERKTLILNILWIPNWWFFSHLHYYQSCNHLAIIFVNWAPIYGPFCWFNCWFLTSQALKLSFQLSLLQDTIRSSFFLNLRSSYTSSLKTKKKKKNEESRFHCALCQLSTFLQSKSGEKRIFESIIYN